MPAEEYRVPAKECRVTAEYREPSEECRVPAEYRVPFKANGIIPHDLVLHCGSTEPALLRVLN